jgi:hypothetical protein
MRRRNRCPKCLKKTVHGGVHCVGCGTRVEQLQPWRARYNGGRYLVGMITLLAALSFLAIGYSDRYVPAVTDWYLQMAAPNVTQPALPFMGGLDDERAFHACARLVVKRMGDERAIATFAAADQERAVSLGDGRYRIESFYDEALEEGVSSRRFFTCQVRYDGREWRVEELNLSDTAPVAVVKS